MTLYADVKGLYQLRQDAVPQQPVTAAGLVSGSADEALSFDADDFISTVDGAGAGNLNGREIDLSAPKNWTIYFNIQRNDASTTTKRPLTYSETGSIPVQDGIWQTYWHSSGVFYFDALIGQVSAPLPFDNAVHHIAIRVAEALGLVTPQLFVDGVPSEDVIEASNYFSIDGTEPRLIVGSALGLPGNLIIDDVAIHNAALSDAAVAADAAAALSGAGYQAMLTARASCISYFKMNEGGIPPPVIERNVQPGLSSIIGGGMSDLLLGSL